MRKMHNRLVKCCRMAALVLSPLVLCPALADWAHDEQAWWEYQVEDGEATVVGIYPELTTLAIPNTLEGIVVTRIAESAFWGAGCEQLETISLPAGVKSLNEDHHPVLLFYSCSSLREIDVDPNNEVYSSFDGVLYDKSKRVLLKCPRERTSVEVAQCTEQVGIYSFDGCVNLVSVVLPSSMKSIGQDAFRGCRRLERVDIPDGVTNIENGAFYDCDSLSSVKIPQSMTSIGPGAFSWCSGLLSIAIPESIESIGPSAFYSCGSLREVSISEGVKSLDVGAFGNCTNLTAVRIPSGVSFIRGGAFEGCVRYG